MPNHCSGSGQRFTAKHVLIPRCRRGMLLPSSHTKMQARAMQASPARTQTLSAAHHLIALEFALVEYHQCAVQNAFTIVAAGINANGVPDLARCMRLVNVPMQSQQRLVTLNSCPPPLHPPTFQPPLPL